MSSFRARSTGNAVASRNAFAPPVHAAAEGRVDEAAAGPFDPGLLDALSGLNSDAGRAVVQRTRRAVRDGALSALQVRRTRRRNAGIATAVVVALLVMLSPALWSMVDELLRGEAWLDLTPMVTLLVVLVLSGVLAALVASSRNQHPGRSERRNI